MSCLNCCKRPVVMAAESLLLKTPVAKKVTFNEAVKVIYFVKAPVDSNVCWQRAARDRHRFERRILDTEQKIGWVFAPQHRCRVFNTLVNS